MSNARLLIVDDDASGRRWLAKLLTKEGYEVDVAADGNEALRLIAERAPTLVITDLNMPKMSGLELLERVRAQSPEVAVVMVTAQDRVASAVAAMRAGAHDYLTKPFDFDTLRLSVERTLAHQALVSEAENLRRQLRTRDQDGLAELLGVSPPMQRVYRLARQVGSSRASVLARGESGTGRRALGRTIHALSGRSGAFVSVDCSSITAQALVTRAEQARGGTLFLHEVGLLEPALQAQLLQLFEARAEVDAKPGDLRVIASSNRDLKSEVQAGRFREDLLYRLSVVSIDVPPLRLRGSDVMVLAEHFLREFARENRRPIEGLSDGARRKVLAHPWPGNLRELQNAMQRAVIVSEGPLVEAEALPFDADPMVFDGIRIPGATLAEIEKFAITKTFDAAEGSTARAAEILDVSLRTVQYRLAEYGIPTKRSKG
ncbi:MAG TPA: sigma-54 dependent transcriptional regulator [Polyangiaceae bacterium]|nr:sigma-54 dependent transcriptional regulator [Polyangiaceae bacterium]